MILTANWENNRRNNSKDNETQSMSSIPKSFKIYKKRSPSKITNVIDVLLSQNWNMNNLGLNCRRSKVASFCRGRDTGWNMNICWKWMDSWSKKYKASKARPIRSLLRKSTNHASPASLTIEHDQSIYQFLPYKQH